VTNTKSSDEIDRIARSFHEAYERLAPEHGYATRRESAVPWDQVPENNKKLMRAVVAEIIPAEVVALRAELAEAHETRELAIQNGAHNVDVLHQQLVRERAAREAAERERDEYREAAQNWEQSALVAAEKRWAAEREREAWRDWIDKPHKDDRWRAILPLLPPEYQGIDNPVERLIERAEAAEAREKHLGTLLQRVADSKCLCGGEWHWTGVQTRCTGCDRVKGYGTAPRDAEVIRAALGSAAAADTTEDTA
jgi:hypothetical protein